MKSLISSSSNVIMVFSLKRFNCLIKLEFGDLMTLCIMLQSLQNRFEFTLGKEEES